MDIRIDFVQNSAGGNSTYIRGIPASGSGTPEIRLKRILGDPFVTYTEYPYL